MRAWPRFGDAGPSASWVVVVSWAGGGWGLMGTGYTPVTIGAGPDAASGSKARKVGGFLGRAPRAHLLQALRFLQTAASAPSSCPRRTIIPASLLVETPAEADTRGTAPRQRHCHGRGGMLGAGTTGARPRAFVGSWAVGTPGWPGAPLPRRQRAGTGRTTCPAPSRRSSARGTETGPFAHCTRRPWQAHTW